MSTPDDRNPVVDAVTGAALGAGGVIASNNIVPGGFTAVADAVAFPGTWKRIGLGALGIWLCWIGVLLILSQTAIVRNAVGAVTSVATKGVVKP